MKACGNHMVRTSWCSEVVQGQVRLAVGVQSTSKATSSENGQERCTRKALPGIADPPGSRPPGTTRAAPPTAWGATTQPSSKSMVPPSDTPTCSGGRWRQHVPSCLLEPLPPLLLLAPSPLLPLFSSGSSPRACITSRHQRPWAWVEGSRAAGSLRLPAADGQGWKDRKIQRPGKCCVHYTKVRNNRVFS